MASISTVEPNRTWVYEYKGWKITFDVIIQNIVHYQPGARARTGDFERQVTFSVPKIEHLAHEKQSMRWTKKRKKIDLKRLHEGHNKYPEGEEEQLCCFICATYMPDKVYDYFEKCKEMTRCANL